MKARVNGKEAGKPVSIRVNTGAKQVEVNDNGETITLNFADQSFPERFFGMAEDFEAKEKGFQAKAEVLDAQEGLTEVERLRQRSRDNLEIHEYFKGQIDSVFGPDTCRKVFGDIVPAIELYGEFFEQLTPFFEEYGKRRQETIRSKYSVARQGNV